MYTDQVDKKTIHSKHKRLKLGHHHYRNLMKCWARIAIKMQPNTESSYSTFQSELLF